ncbi:biotin-dependent carboxyltransferase family protein [Oceanibium sediminis]|uniref:5-oxoprolinase subunit C family protein n=1 Tax=Oceanibium sediminis TaxID=2026339 RepID=UPI000DD490F0|nr:biotin-dependent carboxyltransferase family protein [Oceanibium sediminis]
MSRELIIHSSGPGVTVQDMGRPGYLGFGLSRGGAADRMALLEGAALLGQWADCAALEMAGMGGTFEAGEDMVIALTGAPMKASIDGARIAWNASHALPQGARLSIGAVEQGSYGYLHLAGGIDTPELLGARGTHLAAGLGRALKAGDRLPVGPPARGAAANLTLPVSPRFAGGTVRVVPSLQTEVFPPEEIARFEATAFTRDTRGNRMGVRLVSPDKGFGTDSGLSILSEVIIPGDIQVTGDGTPFVLLTECQTTGGYPRIGSVLPYDLPIVAQAQAGVPLRFRFITLEEGVQIARREQARAEGLRKLRRPLIRDPRHMADLISYQLISGVTAGHDMEKADT